MKNQQNWLQLILCGFITVTSTPANAQITPDNTLGVESSRLTPNVQINGASADRIDGGAVRGSNLFHSFTDFNINDGQRVYFGNPTGIENILTRVTGISASNIFGTLGVDGAANLFLLNPNGIIFGKNAQLDLRGSFLGTTANQIQFGDRGIFSATNPTAPPLLTINPSALLFTQLSGSGITNQSQAPAGINPAGEKVTGLRVADGKSLVLAGGDINIDGGSLRAYGGRIDLAGLAAPGSIGLNVAGDTLSLDIPNDIARADVSLTNAGEVNVRGADAGNIAINAQNLSLGGESKLRAGIDIGLGTSQSQAGNIEINATGTTTLTDGSFIANVLEETSVGRGGDINITTNSLELLNGSLLNTSILGQGDGGDINLNIGDALTLAGVDKDGWPSAIFSSVTEEAVGNGGDINIKSGTVSLTDGGQINSSVFSGQGEAGNITVDARDAINLDAIVGFSITGIHSTLLTDAVGKGGDIRLTTGSLSVTNGASLNTGTDGQGNAGNITINARDTVTFDGVGSEYNLGSSADSVVGSNAVGNGGEIQINATALFLKNGGHIQASSFGQGNAGKITIDARDLVSFDGDRTGASTLGDVGNGGDIQINATALFLKNGGQIKASTFGQGNAGKITIDTRDLVSFDGDDSEASTLGIDGNGGDIQVTTGTLSLTNGGNLSAFASTNGGNITIDARDAVNVDGVGSDGHSSWVVTSLYDGTGKSGDIQITTGSLAVTNGARLVSSTGGEGNGGNIIINARDSIKFDGVGSNNNFTGAYSTVYSTGVGDAGTIELTTGSLFLSNGGQIAASTFGQGDGGDININARDAITVNGTSSNGLSSGVFSVVGSTGVGNAGNIKLTTGSLSLSNGGEISASTFGQGNGGDIDINARDAITANSTGSSGFNSGVSSAVGQTGVGNGGNIILSSNSLSLTDNTYLSALTAGKGNAGNISITGDSLTLKNGTISAQTASSQGGNINLELADFLLLRRGSRISTTAGIAEAGGDGGNITIDTPFIVSLLLENNDITANAFSGKGGNVDINVRSIFGIEARSQPTPQSDITATSELGVQGQVSIQQPNIQPTEGLIELPTQIVDTSDQIGQVCSRGRNAKKPLGEFIVSGRGGSLPPSSLQPLTGINKIRDLATLDGESRLTAFSTPELLPTQNPIIEAQGWVKTPDGKVMLVAQVPTATPNATTASAACPVTQ